jgi:hypothetical protein
MFVAVPFSIEVRCLLDFTLSKTSLDVFQFYQLFNYHYQLYASKIGNTWYAIKPLGSVTPPADKFIFGSLISSIIFTFLIGPFILFSEYGGLVQSNPVTNANV